MNFLTLMQAVALWCGSPTHEFGPDRIKWVYTQQDVQRCRDKMFECIEVKREMDVEIIAACFHAMSFGEIRKPTVVKKRK